MVAWPVASWYMVSWRFRVRAHCIEVLKSEPCTLLLQCTMWALYWMEPSLTPAVIATIPSPSSSVKVKSLAVLLPPYNALISCSASYPLYFHARMFAGQVIKGWDVGLASMAKGEMARLTCKPEFAYGAQGSPPKIPPDSSNVY